MKSKTIQVAIVDDHAQVRAGIKRILARDVDIQVIGEGANGVQALELVRTHNPDIILLDVEMPVMKGDEVARRISEEELRVRVLAVSSYNDPAYIKAMLENGAVGYLTKDEVPRWLVATIHDIAQNERNWASARLEESLKTKDSKRGGFSRRQLKILDQLARNRSSLEIAHSFKLPQKFIDQHIALLMNKFSVNKLVDLRRIAGQLKLA